MKPWMKPFVAQCVTSITDPSYRRRLREELADHLETLAGCFLLGVIFGHKKTAVEPPQL